MVTVAANGTGVTKASFSNYGQGVIDVAAPGSNVYSTVPGGGYGSKSGTSMATPHVVGVAALIASADPGITPAQIRAKLASQANDIACPSDSRCTGTTASNSFFGEGTVNASSEVANGTWKLRVNDNAASDTGKIDAWNLTF